jgi:uncharacterized protein YkwD
MNQNYRPTFDHLERRDVPSAATLSTVNLTAGVLTVIGTDAADTIAISQGGGQITVIDTGRLVKQVPATSVTKIVVDAGFGNDVVIVRAMVTKPSVLYGGYGSDALYGGKAADLLFGGADADYLFGRAGNDALFGGSGDDYLDGGLGVNTLIQDTPGNTRSPNATEQAIVNMVNQERLNNGLFPLAVNVTLTYAAGFHSSQMATRSKATPSNPSAAMQHLLFGVSAPTPATRLDSAGYDDWRTYGENIAFGYTTAQAVMQGWMSSSGHRANILNPNFAEIGVGVVANAAGQLFWTQEFAAR